MIRFLKSYWCLLVMLAAFIIVKIPHLSDSFYWDESWPYASAVHQMYKNGISLLPGAISADLSRGHPMFFHAAAATWLRIFGVGHIAYHSFALFISVGFLAFIYHICLRLFNIRVAILSTLAVCLQVAFFVQSSLVLPEVLVAFMVLASLYFYITEQFIPATICLCILFFTKESGVLAGFVIGIDALGQLFRKDYPLRKKLQGIMAVGIPTVLIALFFIIQKGVYGWYVFPVHSDFIKHTWNPFFDTYCEGCINNFFSWDYRSWLFILFVVLATVFAFVKKQYAALSVIVPGVLVYFMVDSYRVDLIPHHKLLFLIFQLAMIASFYLLGRLLPEKRQQHFVILTGWFLVLYFSFSAVNFFTYRYLLAALIPMIVLVIAFMEWFSSRLSKYVFYPVPAVVVFIGIYSFANNENQFDTGLKMYDGLAMQQDAVHFLELQNAYSKNIAAQSFQHRVHLQDPSTGFLQPGKQFQHVEWEINSHTDYVIFDNQDPDARYDAYTKGPYFRRVHRFQQGTYWVEIYEKVQ